MPIYCYVCTFCGHRWEEQLPVLNRNDPRTCVKCGLACERDTQREIPVVRGDIEPYINIGLGEHVASRADLREKLAQHNAYSPDLMINDTPNAGRMYPEERADLASKRVRPGWGENPQKEDVPFQVYTEGKANYKVIKDQIKRAHGEKREGSKYGRV